MRLTIACSKVKKRNLVLINNDTYQWETSSERPIRQPLNKLDIQVNFSNVLKMTPGDLFGLFNVDNSFYFKICPTNELSKIIRYSGKNNSII